MSAHPQRFGDRFGVERLLGSGGWGTVYAVHDVEQDTHLALKHLRTQNPESLARFKREFRAVAELDDPNLVRLYELFGDGEQGWYYTMERIDGDHLTTALGVQHVPHETFDLSDQDDAEVPDTARAPTADWDRVRDLFGQLAHALRAVHQAGLLHRDLKPSNVMVAGERVVLLDFGIVGDATSVDTDSVGTPAYMAPEQGVNEETTTEATDWYSFGVMLFEVLTGRLPFVGTASTLLAAKVSTDGPDPREVNPSAPRDLCELCVGLLRRDPDQRPDGAAVLRRLGGAPAGLSPVERFVGRRRELDRLHELARAKTPGMVLIEGPSGLGKTALAGAFVQELRDREPDALVLTCRSRQQESVPFKAIDGILDGLVLAIGAMDPSETHALAPSGIRDLCELFPVLLQVTPFKVAAALEPALPDDMQRRRRAVEALRELMHTLATRGSVVWFLDDLHWGDVDSASLIRALFAPPEPPPVMLLATARPEPSPCLERLRESARKRRTRLDLVRLGPLDATESLALLERHGRRTDDLERLAEQAGGHPWLLNTLVRYADQDVEAIDLDQVLVRRLETLADGARSVLALCAVAGSPIDRRVLRRASGMDARFDDAMRALEIARLVRYRRVGEAGGIECYHDRIRETVLASLEPARTRELHAQLAEVRTDSPEERLVHLIGAGRAEQAVDVAIQAAEQAAAALAFSLAAELYQTALDSLPVDSGRIGELRIRRAEALSASGRLVDAAEGFLKAARASDPGEPVHTDLRRRATMHLLSAGRLDDGLELARDVCREIGLSPPGGRVTSLAQVIGGRLWIAWRGLDTVDRAESECDPTELLRHDVLIGIADGLGVVDTTRAAALRQRALGLALRLGEPRRLALSLLGLSQSLGLPGGAATAKANAVFERALPLVDRLDDPTLHAYAWVTRGALAYMRGDAVECGEHMQKALELVETERVDNLFAQNQARVFRIYGYVSSGDLVRASGLIQSLRDLAVDSGNLYLGTFLDAMEASVLLPSRDEPERGYAQVERALEAWSQLDYHIQHWWVLKAQADLDLYCGEPQRCLDRLEEHWPRIDGALLNRVEAARMTNLFLRARAAAAVAIERPQALALARRDRDALAGTSSSLSTAYSAQVSAAIAHVEGRIDERNRQLERAREAFGANRWMLYEAGCRILLAKLNGEPAPMTALEARKIRSPERFLGMMFPALTRS